MAFDLPYCIIHGQHYSAISGCLQCREGSGLPNFGAEALIDAQLAGKPLPGDHGGANARQHGGDHYRKRDYQHWDFVCDTGMHYLLGCATKYVSRWRDKNGHEDLEKALHYIDKAIEQDVHPPLGTSRVTLMVDRFVSQLELNDALTVRHIMGGNYEAARSAINWLLTNDEA